MGLVLVWGESALCTHGLPPGFCGSSSHHALYHVSCYYLLVNHMPVCPMGPSWVLVDCPTIRLVPALFPWGSGGQFGSTAPGQLSSLIAVLPFQFRTIMMWLYCFVWLFFRSSDSHSAWHFTCADLCTPCTLDYHIPGDSWEYWFWDIRSLVCSP